METQLQTVLESSVFTRPSGHYATSSFQWEDTWRTFAKEETFPSEAELLTSTHPETRLRELGGINIAALAFACCKAVFATGLPSFKPIGNGSFNVALLAEFPGGERVVARIPLEDTRCKGLIASQVATMAYACLRLSIPTPFVYAWDDETENPVNAPFVIMQYIHGTALEVVWPGASMEQKVHTLGMLTRHHAALVQNHETFSSFDSLMFSDDVLRGAMTDLTSAKAYCMGPLIRLKRPFVGNLYANWPSAPVESIRDLWEEGYEAERKAMRARWAGDDRNRMVVEQDVKIRNAAKCIGVYWDEVEVAANAVGEMLGSCEVPNQAPCLVHPDFAFRNIIVEEGSLRILSILDWDEAAVLPFDLLSEYSKDLCSGRDEDDDVRPLSSADIYASLPETRHDNPLDVQSVITAYIGFLRKFAFEALSHMDEIYAFTHIFEFGDKAAEVERAILRRCYPYMVASWNEDIIIGNSMYGTDAKLVHLLITRGFTKWCRKREWLKTKLLEPKEQLTERKKNERPSQRPLPSTPLLSVQTIVSIALGFALAYLVLPRRLRLSSSH